MANKLYDEDSIRSIGEAIRTVNGTEDAYKVSEMAPAILALANNIGGVSPEGTLEITRNGTFDVTNFASVIVSVLSSSNNIALGVYEPDTTISLKPISDANISANIIIEHGLGSAPDVALLINITPTEELEGPEIIMVGKTPSTDITTTFRTAELATSALTSQDGTYAIVDDTIIRFGGNGSTYPVRAGHKYLWIAMKLSTE